MRTVVGTLLAIGETGAVYEVLIIRSQTGIDLGKGTCLRVERTEYVTACGQALRCKGGGVFVLESGEILVRLGEQDFGGAS